MNIDKLVRSNILTLKPYTSARETHLSGILLDANENSFGSVITNNLELNRYPDPNQTEIRLALSKQLKIDFKNLFIGVGSDEVIDLTIRIFCEPALDEVIICEPTYGMYKVACDINNVKSRIVNLNEKFDVDIQGILNATNERTKIIFLCSPNNPTGNLLTTKKIIQIAKKFNGIIVVDQAYIDFAEEKNSILDFLNYKNILLLRTFSKAWGLAGVRCGYAIASEKIINLFFKVKSPYNLNKLTANFVLKALKNVKKKNIFVQKIIQEKKKLIEEMNKIEGIEKIFPSDANFILFKVKNSKEIYDKLSAKGIIIRDRSNQINLEGCLRISVGKPKENKQFLRELKKIL